MVVLVLLLTTKSHTILTLGNMTALIARVIETLVPPVEQSQVQSLEFAALVVSYLPSGSSSLEELDLQAR